jgi:D-sedoheptulose 7-phosphate isomerase
MKHIVALQLNRTIETLQATLADTSIADALFRAGELTAQAMRSGRKLMVAGNGGSAADAQHLVAEFVSRLTVNRPAMRAIALTTDTSILTAIGNDYDYNNIFERQLEAIGQEGDVFLGISTSGNSKNVVKGFHKAKTMGITTVGFSGNGGGVMAELCDINVIVPSTVTMHIQEVQLALEHTFCMIVERCYFPDFEETFGGK